MLPKKIGSTALGDGAPLYGACCLPLSGGGGERMWARAAVQSKSSHCNFPKIIVEMLCNKG